MNITFVTPGMTYGGAERVISILSNQWVSMGHNVNILIVGENPECVYELDAGVRVHCIGGLCGKPVISHIKLIKKIKKCILEYGTEVAISFMNDTCAYTAFALGHTKIPLFYSERNDPGRKTASSLKNKFFRKVVESKTAGFVFQTQGARDCYKKSVQKKSKVILNPFNADKLPEYDFENREKEIVTMGRLHPQKNHKMLIDAFAIIADEFKDYKLKIYGDGQLKETLQKQIDDMGLSKQIELMGAQKDILNKINKASLFVLSSDYEGLPNALIEAMCVGVPSVSTDCSPGGAREIIEDGKNGFIVPCNDENALAEAMKKVLSDTELAYKFSVEGQKISERMESAKIAEKWIEYLQS